MNCKPVRALSNIFFIAAAALSWSANAQTGYYRQPAISNDALVFVAEGDIWRAAPSGGIAQRLTTHHAEESNPSISPDGKWLAFTGRYEGPAEVYVMPLAGGQPTRLTFDGDTARVQGWTRDGKVIYASQRYSGKPSMRLYTVDATTRSSAAIPLAEAAEGCYAGASLYFARLPLTSDNVKRYEGGLAQKIWKFIAGAEAAPLTLDYKGTSRQPMCTADRVYFLSDRDGLMNIWSMDLDGRDLKQHTQSKVFDIRGAAIAADGKQIAYQLGADIHMLDTASNATRKIELALQSDFEQTRTRWVKTPWDFVTSVEPSPSGDRVVLTARGQVFVAPVGAGRRIEVTRESLTRARNATFSHDGKAIYAFADDSGEFELMRYPANGVGNGKQLTKGATVLRQRAFPSPDGKWVAHYDKDRRLYLLNLATGDDKVIDQSKFDAYDKIVWSPDSRWITLTRQAENQFETLQLIEVSSGRATQLTSDRYEARDPAFSPDGKWLFYVGNRNLQSLVTSPWGQRSPEPFFDRQSKIYALALDPATRWPFLARDELQKPETIKPPEPSKDAPLGDAAKEAIKAADAKADAAAAAARQIVITLPGLSERLYEVPIPAGNYSDLSTDGKRLYFVVGETSIERKQSLRSVAIEPPNPAAGPATIDLFFDEIRAYALTQDRKKIFIRKVNDLFVFDAGKAAPLPAEHTKFAVNLRDWTFTLDPREEWQQMFTDAWRMHRDYFFDKNMHGADWPKMRAKYAPLMTRVTDRAEVSDVIAQMSAEAAALHSQVAAPDVRRGQDAVEVAALAADLVKTAQGFRIQRLYGGDPELLEERSPLARPEVNVRVGETITAINGIAVGGAANIGELLRNQAARQVLLSVADAAGKSRELIVTPIDTRRDRELRYLTWEAERKARAEKASGNRIGYVHLQAMGANDIARWAREFYPVFQRDGLIIDIRQNNGGSIDSWIIEKLQRRAWHFWQSRQSDAVVWNQQLAFRGHVVALIDANTYSDGETLAQGLRRLGIAPLIGVTTAGAGIWLSDQNRLRDNGIARAAELGVYVDNQLGAKNERMWITEGVGVEPDLRVDNLPHATFNGGDAQLDAAISYLMDKIGKEPVSVPVMPPFPVKAK